MNKPKVVLPIMPPGQRMADTAALARLAEEAGLDGVSYAELSSDPLLNLTVDAGATEGVDLMTTILVDFVRAPLTLATTAAAIQDHRRGRLVLGLGSQITPHVERRH